MGEAIMARPFLFLFAKLLSFHPMLKFRIEAAFGGAAAVLFAAGAWLQPSHLFTAVALRWLAIGLLAAVAFRRRTLTPWIFVAMVAGAEFGFDDPAHAVNLRVFSDIFLRLIKTIVAPLILATLVMGIAGHGDLKSVGRLGVNVNAVAPGFVDTDMTLALTAEHREQIVRRSALRRLVDVDDVANAVEFLLSDKAKNITGTVLTVDAGNTA